MDLNELKNFDFNNLDANNMGSWPTPIKVIVLIIAFVAVLGLGYKFMITEQFAELDRAKKQEQELRTQFSIKQAQAANLDAYKAQLEEMRRSFGAMLRQLPGETEIDTLLVDISQAGLATGLHQELFSPQAEVVRDFYAEVPIEIVLTGTYHQFGEFASAVAALPRIVTLHDIGIEHVQGSDELTMSVVAKTYRYLEDGEASGTEEGAAK